MNNRPWSSRRGPAVIGAWLLLVAVGGLLTTDAAWAQRGGVAPGDRGGRGRRGANQREPDRPNVGDPAVDFRLKSLDGRRTVRLSDYRGKRPVAIIFGSYT